MTTYTALSGKRIAGGREIYPHAVLDLIAAAPGNSWVRLNTNEYQDIWPPVDLRAWYGSGPGNPHNVIDAWSSFAWDHVHHRLLLWGGGHANYNGNEFYVWDAMTRQWQLAYHSVERNGMADDLRWQQWRYSPVSAHTYDNQMYLEGLDRFLTWGGAQSGPGGAWFVYDDEGNVLRKLAGYLCSLSLAGQGMVGGPTGTNAKRGAYAGVDLPGAKPWTPLDYMSDPTLAAALGDYANTINGVSDAVVINGLDVVFQTFRFGTSRSLRRITMPSLDWRTHTIVKCGSGGSISSAHGSGCYIPNRDIFVLTGKDSSALYFWRAAGTSTSGSNPSFAVNKNTGLTGPGADALRAVIAADPATSFRWGMDYDPLRDQLVAWDEWTLGRVFGITPPSGSPTPNTGWYVEVLADPAVAPRPTGLNVSKGTIGKFKHAPDLDCFIGLQDTYRGNVWAFKPAGWIDPRS